jgi:hypothetical protein
MRLVIIESPYAGNIWQRWLNRRYARVCVRDSLIRGESPIASHLLYTQPGILRDHDPAERQWGIDAGLAWRSVADATAVYIDRGISKGMWYGIQAARESGRPIEWRSLHAEIEEWRTRYPATAELADLVALENQALRTQRPHPS